MGCTSSYNVEQVVHELLEANKNKQLLIPDITRLISKVPKRHRTQAAMLIMEKYTYSGKSGTLGS